MLMLRPANRSSESMAASPDSQRSMAQAVDPGPVVTFVMAYPASGARCQCVCPSDMLDFGKLSGDFSKSERLSSHG